MQLMFVAAAVMDTDRKVSEFVSQQRIAESAKRGESGAGGSKAPTSPEELARLEKKANAAKAALAQLRQLCERWYQEAPTTSLCTLLTMLLDPKEFDKREQYLLKAVELDPKSTSAYNQLVEFYSDYDNQAAARWAQKAWATRKHDTQLAISYAGLLWTVDPDGARNVYREIISQHAGTREGAAVLSAFISSEDDRNRQVKLIEELRREYSRYISPGNNNDNLLFKAYVTTDPGKGLTLAQEVLKAVVTHGSNGPGRKPATRSGAVLPAAAWRANVAYAQALVNARKLLDSKQWAQAAELVAKTKAPRDLGSSALLLLNAEAAAGAGDTAKAYELIAASLTREVDAALEPVLAEYGATLGKSPHQVEEDIWTRRMSKAQPFKEFDLRRLGGDDRVKLADLRGKVVIVDFWYPA